MENLMSVNQTMTDPPVRARQCPLCEAPEGRPCLDEPAGDHVARYLDAYTTGQLTKAYMGAVLGEFVVIDRCAIVSAAAVTAPDLSAGLEELAGLINFRVGAWHDFGYETPPTPESKAIPPLGERSAEAIRAGHEAIEAIDELTGQLYALRSQLVGELRQDEDVRADRVDAMLARQRQERQS
jgi:hypothetical protein